MVRRVLGIALVLTLVPVSDATACTIAGQTPRQRVRSVRIAVYVEVVAVRTLRETRPGASDWEATVRRLMTFKGRPARVFRVRSNTETSTCGLSMFEAGQRVGLLLNGPRPPFRIGTGSTISLGELRRARQ